MQAPRSKGSTSTAVDRRDALRGIAALAVGAAGSGSSSPPRADLSAPDTVVAQTRWL